MFRLLEGKNVNLRVTEKEDLPLLAEWFSKPEVLGEYEGQRQTGLRAAARRYPADKVT